MSNIDSDEHSSELDDLARDLISYAHAPIGHAKIGKKGDTYIMDAAETDALAEWIVRYGIDRFKVILARERQKAVEYGFAKAENIYRKELDLYKKLWYSVVKSEELKINNGLAAQSKESK